MSKFSFKKGYYQVPYGEITQVRSELMIALKLKNRTAFHNRLNGKTEPKVSEAEAIESVFKRHGINDIWGDPSPNA